MYRYFYSYSGLVLFITVTCELRGCVVNGILYGDTSIQVGINFVNTEIPKDFKLQQNYPNPFNPVTKIEYQLPNSANVFLAVYDILGREIKTLTNEFKTAGYYEALFDVEDLSSGIYLYRIKIADDNSNEKFAETKRMILLK